LAAFVRLEKVPTWGSGAVPLVVSDGARARDRVKRTNNIQMLDDIVVMVVLIVILIRPGRELPCVRMLRKPAL
jgi:hypothetical protein